MAYLLSSIREAESLSNKGLKADLTRAGVYCQDWDRFDLVAEWLRHFGATELDDAAINRLMVQVYREIQ